MSTSRSCFSVLSLLLEKMHWLRKSRRAPKCYTDHLEASFIRKTPKGFVPIIVGDDEKEAERFMVHVKLLSKPCMVDFLELAARQFGYNQEGVLRVPCDPCQFQNVLESFSQKRFGCAEFLFR